MPVTSYATSPELEITPGLKPAVDFWIDIFASNTTRQGLIHDDENLNIVYKRLNINSESSKKRRKIVSQETSAIRKRLSRLASGAAAKDGLDRKILSYFNNDRSKLLQAKKHVRFQLGQANRFQSGLKRSGSWMHDIKRIFDESNIPKQLIALPFLESGYNPKARSHIGALGLWQFMSYTAKRFMTVNRYVDERLDPILATESAAKLLNYNYKVLGSWPIAITAYNHGLGGMRRAVRVTGTTNIETIIATYKGRRFKFASRNFYPELLAVAHIYKNRTQYFSDVSENPPLHRQKLKIKHYIMAEDLKQAFSLSFEEFIYLNPHLRKSLSSSSKRIPKNTTIFVPAHKPLKDYMAKLEEIPSDQKHLAQIITSDHLVESGDTLIGIANLYQISVQELMLVNNLEWRSIIRAGQNIALPTNANLKAALAKSNQQIPVSNIVPPVKKVENTPSQKLARIDRYAAALKIPFQKRARLRSLLVPVLYPNDEELTEILRQEQEQGSADPTDYSVSSNGTITVEEAETLGHYSEWLEIDINQLRSKNRMSRRSPLYYGRTIKLVFDKVTSQEFEERRYEYHRIVQQSYFDQYSVDGVDEYKVKRNETLLGVSNRTNNIPIWLLRQYNPELEGGLYRGMVLTIPLVLPKEL